jgi:hypothetical protein
MKRTAYPKGRAASPFVLLDRQHQQAAVLRLADSKVPDHGIAQMIGWPVGDVRRIIAERAAELRAKGEVSS